MPQNPWQEVRPTTANPWADVSTTPMRRASAWEEARPSSSDASDDGPSLLERIGLFGARVVPAVVGGILGGTVGSAVPVAGTAAGAAAGGAAGAALGEGAAEWYEKKRGYRTDISPASIAVSGALGAIPLGAAGGIAKNVGKGALMGGGSTVAMSLADNGELPSVGETAMGAATGGAFGGGTAALARLLRVTPSASAREVEPAAGRPVPSESSPAARPVPRVPERPRETPLPSGAVKRVQPDAADVQTWAEANPGDLPGHQTIEDITNTARLRPIQPGEHGTEAGQFAPKFVAYAAERAKARSEYDAAVAAGDHEAVAAAATTLTKARQAEVRMASDFGRNLRVTQELAPKFMTLADDGIDRAIKAGVPEQDVADLLSKAGNDPDQWIQGLRAIEAAHQTGWEKFKSYYIANILSGPMTQIRNVVGNTTAAATKLPMTALEAGVDAVRVARHGGERVTTLGEVGAQARAIPASLKKGAAEAGEIFRKGYSTASGDLTALDKTTPELTGVLKPLNAIGRLMRGTDALFRNLASDMELAGQLHTAKVSEPTAAMTTQATETGLRATYQEDPGKITGAVLQAKKALPFLDYIIPFVKTPGNILKQGFEYSPAGFLMKGAKASEVGQRTANAVQARAIAGTAALAPLWMLAASGRLSGRGPTQPAQRAALMESGWRPNSLKVGDTWHSYAPLAHLAVPMSAVANAYETIQRDPDADPIAKLFHTAIGTAGSVLNQSYLSQAGALVTALNDPGDASDKAAAFLGRMAGGVVPFSGALRAAAQVTDPVIRRPDTGNVVEMTKANLPGLSTTVTPRLDRFGKPVSRTGGPVGRAINVFQSSPEVHDPVADALKRAGVNLMPAKPDTDVRIGRNAVPLNKTDALTLGQNKGNALYDLLLPVISRPGFQARPAEQQKQLIDQLIARARAVEEQKATRAVRRGEPVARR